VTLDMPLERIHPLASKAAEATHCAEDQGQFWEMHDRLFENQKALEPWSSHAEALGMDVAAFDACMSSGKHAEAVKRDMAEAQKAGATGTPSFVLALTDPDDPTKVEGLAFIRGAQPFASFKSAIDGALEELD
jgi:protein-disulfide isomerase